MAEDRRSRKIVFTVADIDASVAKTEGHGASLLQPAVDKAGGGRMATLTDPQGARFALITDESMTSRGTAGKENPDGGHP